MSQDMIEIWNIQDGVNVYAGAQKVFNILGRLNNAEIVESLVYSLNNGPEIQVYFRSANDSASRLARHGDFNIDTITRDQLLGEDKLQLFAGLKDGTRIKREFSLNGTIYDNSDSHFSLDLSHAKAAQEVGQYVDGKWVISRDEMGQTCLEIRPEDAGLDRIILFGSEELRTAYTIRSRLQVNRWLRPVHNVGLLFKWNPHLQGDGTCLPSQWTTGLGYYYSDCPGLRVRIGIDVHLNENGEKIGDNILGEAKYSSIRYWTNKVVRKITRGKYFVPQIIPGLHYWFELKVNSNEYTLTVWPVNNSRPSPQVVVNDPPDLLEKGAVGIIAHYCALRVFEFHIESHTEQMSGL